MMLKLPNVRSGSDSRSDSGAIIVIFAICLVPLIALIALAIDIGRMAEASSKTKGTVGLASLAGLEAYYLAPAPGGETDPLKIHKFRLGEAIDRIEELLALTESSTVGHAGLPLVKSGQQEFKEGSGALDDRQTDTSGTITPGQWFFSEPAVGCANWKNPDNSTDTSACPCQGATKGWAKPCFRANSSTETIVTALKIDYHTKESGGVSTAVEATFSRVLGYDSLHFGVSTIAAVAPRALAFSVDNSRSMTFGNFLQWDGSPGNARTAAEYVYPLRNTDPPCIGSANPCTDVSGTPNGCRFATASSGYFRGVYNAMVVDGPRPGVPLRPNTYHYYDDYECFNIDNNGVNERYLIATKIGYNYDNNGDKASDGVYNGPEPLNSVLQGIYTVATSLEKISVAGDRILVFSFDNRTPNDLTGMPADKRRAVGPTSVGEEDFKDLKRLVKTEGQSAADVTNRINALFFPLAGASTDIPGAMAYALDQLNEMGANESLRMHTMFSDGVTQCSHRGGSYQDFLSFDSGTNKFTLKGDTCMDAASDPTTPAASGLKNTVTHDSSTWGNYAYGNHIWSLWEASAIASRDLSKLDGDLSPSTHNRQKEFLQDESGAGKDFKTYQELGMKFNFVAVGDPAMPHTLLKKSPNDPNKCMTDSEARKADDWFVTYDPTYVDDAWAKYNSGGTPTPYALATNYMYEAAKQTDGFYFPVRKPCSAVDSRLDSSCKFKSGGSAGKSMQTYLDNRCKTGYRHPGMPDNNACWGSWGISHVYDVPYSDNCGRLTCDPQCKNVGEQVETAMKQMLSQNPFVLVSELDD